MPMFQFREFLLNKSIISFVLLFICFFGVFILILLVFIEVILLINYLFKHKILLEQIHQYHERFKKPLL